MDAKLKVRMYCKNCTYRHELNNDGNADHLCMYKSNYSKEHPLYYRSLVNKFTPYDMTLPRSSTIICPYKEDHPDEPNEVVFVRYDDENLRYLYVCCAKNANGKKCLTCWKMPGFQSNEVLFKMGA